MKSLLNKFRITVLAAVLALGSFLAPVTQVAQVAVTAAPSVASIAAPAVAIVASTYSFDVQAGPFTDYLENKIVDWLFRGQSFTPPATLYFSLHTASCSDSSPGTEVTGGSYARVAVTASLANFAGTQSAGSTSASSGTSGTTSNNGAITFAAPTANWGSITHIGINDASTSGNQLACNALTIPKTVNNGDAAPSFAAGALTIQVDN